MVTAREADDRFPPGNKEARYAPEEARMMHPCYNVMLIVMDTLGANYVGCYGNDVVKTPNIDRLAMQGTLFENAYSEGLPTIPCRRAMMTGRFTLPFGGWKPLEISDTSITDILWGRGIQTALIYDSPPLQLPKYGYTRGFDYVSFLPNHELDHEYLLNSKRLQADMDPLDYTCAAARHMQDNPIVQGMLRELKAFLHLRQDWRGDEDSYPAAVAREAVHWLEHHRDPSRPFFLWVDCFDPHEPWDAPSVWEKRPCPYDPDYEGNPIVLAPQADLEGFVTERECRHIRALHAEKVTNADKWMGKVLDALRRLGLDDNTIVILVGDHGQPMGKGEHGHGILRKCRPWPYEELAHVPLIVRVPGQEGGRRIESFVQTCDIAPTVLDGLGVFHAGKLQERGHEGIKVWSDSSMQGISLLPAARGETDHIRDWALTGFFGFSWSLIRKDYSVIRWLRAEPTAQEMVGLFMDDIMNGGAAGAKSARLDSGFGSQQEKAEMWTCTPGAEVILPEDNELYDRVNDRFQLTNIAAEKPEVAREMLGQLNQIMNALRNS